MLLIQLSLGKSERRGHRVVGSGIRQGNLSNPTSFKNYYKLNNKKDT